MQRRHSYDRLKNIGEQTVKEIKCPDCESKTVKLSPIDKRFKKSMVNNSDLPDELKRELDSLPFIHTALKRANGTTGILLECGSCNRVKAINNKIKRRVLNKKIRDIFGPEPADLGSEYA